MKRDNVDRTYRNYGIYLIVWAILTGAAYWALVIALYYSGRVSW